MSAPFALLTIRNGVACCLMIAATALLAVGAIGPLHALVLAAGVLHGRWSKRPVLPPRAWDALAVVALRPFPRRRRAARSVGGAAGASTEDLLHQHGLRILGAGRVALLWPGQQSFRAVVGVGQRRMVVGGGWEGVGQFLAQRQP